MPSVTVNMAGVRARKRKMVDGEVRLHLELYKASGAELIMGEAHFIAQKTVEVRSTDGTTRVLSGDQVFLNLGTHAAIPDVPGLKAAKPMTHVEALELDRVPEHLVVLGGGFSWGSSSHRQCEGSEAGSPYLNADDNSSLERIQTWPKRFYGCFRKTASTCYLILISLESKDCPVWGLRCVCAI
jgi:Pyridine nucleotide-disulphide oxidoreductase